MVIVFEHVSHTVDFKERGALTLTETTAEVCDLSSGVMMFSSMRCSSPLYRYARDDVSFSDT